MAFRRGLKEKLVILKRAGFKPTKENTVLLRGMSRYKRKGLR